MESTPHIEQKPPTQSEKQMEGKTKVEVFNELKQSFHTFIDKDTHYASFRPIISDLVDQLVSLKEVLGRVAKEKNIKNPDKIIQVNFRRYVEKNIINHPNCPLKGEYEEIILLRQNLLEEFLRIGQIDFSQVKSADLPKMNHEILLSQEEKEIVELYNKGRNDTELKNQFMNKFNPKRIGTMNAMERYRRYRGLEIAPLFKSSNAGDFYGIQSNNEKYYVVPRYDLTYQESVHNPGAGDILFDDEDVYDPHKRYRNITIVSPAVMKKESNGQFTIIKKGLLRLGEGEKITIQ